MIADWESSLEAWVAHTGDPSWRDKCADSHPQHRIHRAFVLHEACVMIGLCDGVPPPSGGASEWPPRSGNPSHPHNPSVAETLELIARMKRCPFRSVDPGCGCSGGRCAIKRGAAVGHKICFDCLASYG